MTPGKMSGAVAAGVVDVSVVATGAVSMEDVVRCMT